MKIDVIYSMDRAETAGFQPLYSNLKDIFALNENAIP